MKTCFIKISGDKVSCPKVVGWLKKITREFFAVICVGGGTQISRALSESGIPSRFGPLGREITTFKGRQIARDVLELNQVSVQDALADAGIKAVVVIPVLDIGGVLCHVNGDTFLQAAYLGFDKLFAVTTPERLERKRKAFATLPRIEVVAF